MDELGKHIPHSTVLLLQIKDSSLVKGVVSDSEGKFLVEEIPSGKYLLSGSMLGYETTYIPEISVRQNNQAIKIILREKLSDLSEVTVQAQKPLFEQLNDRFVVNVRNSIISSGSNVLDVLSRTPGIVVNQQNNSISINGKEGVMVMLNDKLVRLPLDAVVQMLSGMNADQVEKIEIISSPPARYDSEGNAGLINIVNYVGPEMGTNGSFSANMGYGRYERLGSSININHRSKKVNLFMDVSGKMDRMLMFTEMERTVLQSEQLSYSFFEGRREYRLWTLNFGSKNIKSSRKTTGAEEERLRVQ
jgi:hypothetical protein